MPSIAVNYGALLEDRIDNDGEAPIRDLTVLDAVGTRGDIPESLTIDVTVSGEGDGEPPTIQIQVADAEPGVTPPRPTVGVIAVEPSPFALPIEGLAFETIATSDPLDGGTWSQTFERAQLKQFLRVRWRNPHRHRDRFDPRWREWDGWVLNAGDDIPRAARQLQIIATGTPAS